MAHLTTRSAYERLSDRLNRFPQGAPPSELLYKILKMLFSEKEAELVSVLPIRPFTINKAARAWKMNRTAARRILDTLAERAILVDMPLNGRQFYCLPPPIAGFFEFSLMRTRQDINQKVLSELLYQYLNVEEDFIKALFFGGETQLGRVFVQEPVLSKENTLHVLDYEKAGEIIRTAGHIGVSLCYCRHKMTHVGRNCDAPQKICMTFNTAAGSLIKHGYARRIDVSEGLDLLNIAYENNLVQFGENVQVGVNFICNCCGCCCEALTTIRRFGQVYPIHSNFIPQIQADRCNGCGKCQSLCPVAGVALVPNNGTHSISKKQAKINESICLGCGVCARVCPASAVYMQLRPQRVITPVDTVHRTVMMAVERGTFEHLIFDNQVLFSHRALAAVLGAVLRLPPVKQMLANQQVKSRYLNRLIHLLNLYPEACKADQATGTTPQVAGQPEESAWMTA